MKTKNQLFLSIIILAAHLTGCGSSSKAAEKPIDITPIPAPTVAALDQNQSHIEKLAEKVTEHVAQHHEPEGVAPEKALQWLKNGNTRFVKGYLRKDGADKKDLKRLSTGQKPHSIVLSCADSRVPPELVFDQKLGEIFVVRTAGETLDFTAIASIEYAIEHLGTRNIVVMGHTQCGAVKAALATLTTKEAGSPNLNKLVADIHPRLSAFVGKTPSANLVSESWANTKGVAQDLLQRSTLVAEKVKSGDVKIVSALYHLDAGTVDFEP
jgi:carbonic anhydrase